MLALPLRIPKMSGNSVTTRTFPYDPKASGFRGAFLWAVLAEGAVAVGLVLLSFYHKPAVTVGLRRQPMAVHFVTLPKPPVLAPVIPKPQPPRVLPKIRTVAPRVRPVLPRPLPVPVAHHRPVPLPRPPRAPVAKVSPPSPKPVAVVQHPSPAVVAQAIDRYAVMLRTRIQEGLVVPAQVAALGVSGRTTLVFKLTPRGQLVWVRVAHSSGVALIDRASLAAVRSRSYPAFAQTMPHHAVVFQVRVGLNGRGNRF